MTIPDLDALERAAQAATPGPWQFDDGNSSLVTLAYNPDGPNFAPDDNYGVIHCGDLEMDLPKEADARFIEKCDPQTILRLIAMAREAATLRGRVIEECAAVIEKTDVEGDYHWNGEDSVWRSDAEASLKSAAAAFRALK